MPLVTAAAGADADDEAAAAGAAAAAAEDPSTCTLDWLLLAVRVRISCNPMRFRKSVRSVPSMSLTLSEGSQGLLCRLARCLLLALCNACCVHFWLRPSAFARAATAAALLTTAANHWQQQQQQHDCLKAGSRRRPTASFSAARRFSRASATRGLRPGLASFVSKSWNVGKAEYFPQNLASGRMLSIFFSGARFQGFAYCFAFGLG